MNHPNAKFLGTRSKTKEGKPYEWKTWKEVYEIVENFAKGMLDTLKSSLIKIMACI
jgi:long-subunit acyl-CoA synthetase (AMP-forming)